MSNNLPTITSLDNLVSSLAIWRQRLNPVIARPKVLRSPFNLLAKATTGTTGISLSWELVKGADGYIISYSDAGDFSQNLTLVKITNGSQLAYFDDLGVNGKKRYYRIAATSGTISAPQSVLGNQSAPISSTSGTTASSFDTTSHTSGSGGWNQPVRTRNGISPL